MGNITLDDRSKTQGYEWSIRSWKNWADKNNCELFVLDQPIYDLSEMKPQWHKLLVFDLLENEGIDYDQILFVDSDTIVHPDCPNFFETSENKYCGVTAVGSMDWICRSIENYSTYLFDGYTFPYWKYINSGFMIMNKTHKPLFKSILNFYFANQERIIWMQNNLGVGTDQPIINFFLNLRNNIDFKLLSYKFNMQDMFLKEILDEELTFTKLGWIYHYNAIPQNPRMVEYWMERTYKELYGEITDG